LFFLPWECSFKAAAIDPMGGWLRYTVMPLSPAPALLWFRNDLRVSDNPALTHAVDSGRPVVAVYVLDQISHGLRPLGAASLWWLHGSLEALQAALAALGIPLVLRRGPSADVIRDTVDETHAGLVVWNRRYEPAAVAIDSDIKAELQEGGIEVVSCNASLLVEPWDVTTKAGDPFRVFTPFWRAATAGAAPREPLPPPRKLSGPSGVTSDQLADWKLEPASPDWAGGFRSRWQRGEQAAQERLASFIAGRLDGYAEARDRPDSDGTSGLSPHLRFGEISPFQVWHAVRDHGGENASRFRTEIGWREFNYHIMFHAKALHEVNFQPRFDAFPWTKDTAGFEAWTRGRTGYPIVDAGMRQLWETGWMHNRVRMIVGSFLIKDLLGDWRLGEKWFWDTLVDADPASNAGNWQWVAGSGADAAPFFRIFNPVRQGEKFDPRGDYVRRYVPELASMPDEYVHRPWEAGADVLAQAGVVLGTTYPRPIVDHREARDAALEAFRQTRMPSE
jgi:deoxyribodipyrimidine photo-lyase